VKALPWDLVGGRKKEISKYVSVSGQIKDFILDPDSETLNFVLRPFAKFIPQREKSRFRLARVDKYDPDPDPNPERRQNDADPHVDPTVSFTHVGKSEFFAYIQKQCQSRPIVLSFSSTSQTDKCHLFRSGSAGSGKTLRIQPDQDPDPQYSIYVYFLTLF
jgi:hypothetical protein